MFILYRAGSLGGSGALTGLTEMTPSISTSV
jgi:hypothetical protein